MTRTEAPGKVILVGEHAVVYGRPAIAVPVWETTAVVEIVDGPQDSGCRVVAPQIDVQAPLATLAEDDPLGLIIRLSLQAAKLTSTPDWAITIHSSIPIAGGLGSGAAISAALVRAILIHAGCTVDPATVNDIVFAGEEIYHGTPSGIDNTTVTYGMPIWFIKGRPPLRFTPGGDFALVVADSGIAAPTKETVGDVRRGWATEPARYETLFNAIANVVTSARVAMEQADWPTLGACFDQNQDLLQILGVSSTELETLIDCARDAGALGAKLSGGGRGGNIIALAQPEHAEAIRAALVNAGARRVILTTVRGTTDEGQELQLF